MPTLPAPIRKQTSDLACQIVREMDLETDIAAIAKNEIKNEKYKILQYLYTIAPINIHHNK